MTFSSGLGSDPFLSLGLQHVRVSIGWLPRAGAGTNFDIDVSCFLLGQNGKMRSNADLVFYNNPRTEDGSVRHSGDERKGRARGDAEAIDVNLKMIPGDVRNLLFTATIFKATERGQHFGMIQDAYIRVLDLDSNEELVKIELTEDAPGNTTLLFGRLCRVDDAHWTFRTLSRGYDLDLREIARQYGGIV